MRTLTNASSMEWIGANPSGWAGAITPPANDFPLGVYALTLTNLIPGSAVQVESGSTVFHFSTAAGSTLLVNLNAYAEGSPLNNLTIKVRKGSAAPYYQPYRTETTAVVGSQAIYVSQIEDQ